MEAGAISVMASYNEIDGVPSHASRWLLRDVLREEWGFEGFVVSDYYAISELHYRPEVRGHAVAKDKEEACVLAVAAGVNIELPEPDCYLHLADLVRRKALKESRLDELVAPMLLWKFRMGLFDDPYVDPDEAERIVGCDEHRELALRAARETITLLKNEGGLAPLDPGVLQCVAVIGPNAHRMLLGGYSSTPKHDVTVLEGIQARLGERVQGALQRGLQDHRRRIVAGRRGNAQQSRRRPPPDRRSGRGRQAGRRRRLALGGNEQTSREAWSFHHLGDRASLDLFGRQEELVRRNHGHRETGGRIPVQRPAAGDRVSSAESPRHFRMLVPGPGDRPRGGRRAVRRFQSGRQAAHHHSPLGRPSAGVLQLQAYGPAGLSVRRRFTALPVRLRPELHHFRNPRRAAGEEIEIGPMARPVSAPTSRTRATARQRSRADVHSRPLQFRHAADQGTEGIPSASSSSPAKPQTVEFEITSGSLAFYDIRHEIRRSKPGEFEIMVGNSSQRYAISKHVILTVR